MRFPDASTCHGTTYEWRAAQARSMATPGVLEIRQAHRSCAYCGSMHPEDFLAAVSAGARLELADMKYGRPHKVYVTGFPHPDEGLPVQTGTTSRGGVVLERHVTPGGRGHGKFYLAHLTDDLEDEAFAAVAQAVGAGTGVRFVREADGKVRYSC